MHFFSADAKFNVFNFFFFSYETMKKPASEVAHDQPKELYGLAQFFFSLLTTGPNPAQISIPAPKKSELLYNDFTYPI